MFISKVTIKGFKAFAEMNTFGEFSPSRNCIYGLNGSGKSTFVQAIEFVLLDAFEHLRPNERQALLYNSEIGKSAAFVEIVFNNSDRRLPIPQDTVSIRRSIGFNKDEYFIDRKQATRTAVRNLFDTARISLSSGLFIIEQGRVKQIAEGSDEARLELLYEVAGMKTYDEKKNESIKLMGEAHNRIAKIENDLAEITKRLQSLESETSELREYERLDDRRRALEYVIYQQEKLHWQERIERAQTDMRNEKSALDEINSHIEQQNKLISEHRETLHEKERLLADCTDSLARSTTELDNRRKKQSEYDFKIEKLQKRIEKATEDLEKINHEIEESTSERDRKVQKSMEFEDQWTRMTEMKQKMSVLVTKPEAMRAKQSEKEQEIQKLMEQRDTLEHRLEEAQTTLSGIKEALDALGQEEDELMMRSELKAQEREKLGLFDKQKEAWKRQKDAQYTLDRVKHALTTSQNKLSSLMGKGVAAAMEYIKQKNYPIIGQLFELFECDPSLYSAVESVARTRLYYLIVEDEKTASQIIKSLDEDKAGRISIFVLSMLDGGRQRSIERTSDITPLIDELVPIDERVRPVIEEVFGSVALCSDIEVASYADPTFTYVTLKGDVVLPGGAIRGGVDSATLQRKSPLSARQLMSRCEGEICRIEEDVRISNERAEQLADEIAQKKREIEHMHSQLARLTTERSLKMASLSEELRQWTEQVHIFENKIEKLNRAIEVSRTDLTVEPERIEITEADAEMMLYAFDTKAEKLRLSGEDRDKFISYLMDQSDEAGKEIFMMIFYEVSGDCATGYLRLESIRSDISVLNSRIRKLENSPTFERADNERKLEKMCEKKERTTADMDSLAAQIEENRAAVAELGDEIKRMKYESNDLEATLRSLEGRRAIQQNFINECNKEICLCSVKIENWQSKITAIGALPPKEEIESRMDRSYTELMREMRETNEELQGFRFVNKRADDQLRQFTNKQMELESRREELKESEEAIFALIADLDAKRHEAMRQCLHDVLTRFTGICAELDEHMDAQIVVRQRDLEYGDDRIDPSKVYGLGVIVGRDGKDFGQLSGGQKTVIALALIFAIQQMEPAPFYILDEVDADLDEQHATNLGNLITRMSNPPEDDPSAGTQFIYTTHRDAMLAVSEKFFAVRSNANKSTVTEFQLEQIEHFRYRDEDD